MIAVISPEEALRRQETNQVIAEVRENQNQPTGSQNSDQTTGGTSDAGGTDPSSPFSSSPNISIEVPLDLEEVTRENLSIVRELVDQRAQENERFIQAMSQLMESRNQEIGQMIESQREAQQEGMNYYTSNLHFILLGAGVLILLVLVIVLLVMRRQNMPAYAPSGLRNVTALAGGQTQVLEGGHINERLMIESGEYEEAVKTKKLQQLHGSLKRGNVNWESLQLYMGELNMEIKMELLNMVDKKLEETQGKQNIKNLLLPFMNDSSQQIQQESKKLLARLSQEDNSFFSQEAKADDASVLSVASLTNYGFMIDAKTGRNGHAQKVSRLVYEIVKRLPKSGLDPEESAKAALIYDIGFLEISDEILKKSGALTKEEFELMKSHTEKGVAFFSHVDLPEVYVQAIRFHHERMDGSGYPNGLEGDNIPVIARIIAVADMFNAAISPRPYKNALTPELAVEMMNEVSGAMIDTAVFEALKFFLSDAEHLEFI
jgi:HD-GYP domain-containing protein (c-di-GMP phosphodiesterase class II)